MLDEVQSNIAALPLKARTVARSMVIDLLRAVIHDHDPDFRIHAQICESNWVAEHLPTEKALVALVGLTHDLDRIDPDYTVREAYRWLRVLLNDQRSDACQLSS